MYAILRQDLDMTPGKSASQAGHAFDDSISTAPEELVQAYRSDHKTKIVLSAKNYETIHTAYEAAKSAGISCSMIVEENHVMPGTVFDGNPIITAIGIGPVERSEAKPICRRFKLMK